MTHQQALDILISIRHALGQVVDKGMEQRFVDMQQPLPREIEFDLIGFQDAASRLLEHATTNSPTIFPMEH